MKARMMLFLFLGVVTGTLTALLVALTMLPPKASELPVSDSGPYISVLGHGAAGGIGLGLVHGLFLFLFTIGDTPTIERRNRGVIRGAGLAERFDFRRFGSKILPIALIFSLVFAFVLLPLIADPSAVDTRSPTIRLVACFVFAGIWTVSSMIVNTLIVAKLSR